MLEHEYAIHGESDLNCFQCNVYFYCVLWSSVLYTVYGVQCTNSFLLCNMYIIQSTMYLIQGIKYSKHFTMNCVQYNMLSVFVHCTVYSVCIVYMYIAVWNSVWDCNFYCTDYYQSQLTSGEPWEGDRKDFGMVYWGFLGQAVGAFENGIFKYSGVVCGVVAETAVPRP